MPECRSLALVEDGELGGLGTIRRCRQGYKVGPLYAPGRAAAERLLRGLADLAAGEELFLDLPGPNAAGMAMARDLGLDVRFETARMYRGSAPDLVLDRVFGITTFESAELQCPSCRTSRPIYMPCARASRVAGCCATSCQPVRPAARSTRRSPPSRRARSPSCAGLASASRIGLEGELWLVIHLMIAGRLHWRAPGRDARRAWHAAWAGFRRGHAGADGGGRQAARVPAHRAGRERARGS